MEKFILSIHSIVDVITNSSTELFIIDTEKAVDLVNEIIREKEKEFPSDYGYHVSVSRCESWDLQDMYGYYDDDEVIKYLKAKGYKIEPPSEDWVNTFITITCERGGMNESLKSFIKETFNVVHFDN